MISIREGIPTKLPGLSSLYINFDYNNDIINILKAIRPSNYDSNTLSWEVPTSELSNLIDSFCYIDGIDLSILPNVSKTTYDIVVPHKTKMFSYQEEGVRYGLNTDKWMLLDQPGLGKTLQIIYLAEELKAQKGLEHCLIICGVNSLKTNWKEEIKKHSTLDCRVLGERINSKGTITYGSVKERAEELKSPIKEFFIITNIETLRGSPKRGSGKKQVNEIVEAFNHSENNIGMIAIDEAHKMKDQSSLQADALLKLEAKFKVAATGTPIVNSALDAYVPLRWIGENKSLLTKYKEYYTVQGGLSGYQVLGFKNMDVLQEHIATCSLRRKKDLLDLPEKTIINEVIDMSTEHQKLYDMIKNGIKDESLKVNLDQANLLSLVTRLRQATSCPSILTDKPVLSSKYERVLDLVEQLVAQDEKVVIFCSYKQTVAELQNLLKSYNPSVITGDTKQFEADTLRNEFQNTNNKKVLIATWQKLGTGFTLNSASYMICVDCAWTPSSQEQTEDRIHRIGTVKPVFIYRLICKGTIDERVAKILEDKQALADYLVDGEVVNDRALDSLRQYILDL